MQQTYHRPTLGSKPTSMLTPQVIGIRGPSVGQQQPPINSCSRQTRSRRRGKGADHLAGQNVPLEGLCLVQGPGEAGHKEEVTAALDHGVLQQGNGHLQHG